MTDIENITIDNFKPFGTVLEFSEGSRDNFCIIDTEEKEPWRLAVFRFNNRQVKTLEKHVTSKETFEPLKGMAILIVAKEESPEDLRAFILEKPVCLKKGIWHQVISLTESAEVKITENLYVGSEFYDLNKSISCFMG